MNSSEIYSSEDINRTKPVPVYAYFPKDLENSFRDNLSKKFIIAYFTVFGIVGALVLGLSFIQPANELTQEQALKIKERYARLELQKPEEKEPEKPKKEEKSGGQQASAKASKAKIDRSNDNDQLRQARKQQGSAQRAEVRAALKQEIEQSGLFAELTALGDEGEGEIDDVLAQGENADLGGIDLNNVGFTTRPKAGEISKTRKGERITSSGIGEQKIVKAEVKKIEVSADITLASPTKIEGEASGESSRSAEQIEKVIAQIKNQIKLQFEKYLRQDPSLSGSVDVEFTIKADGSVNNIRISKSSLNHPTFERRLMSMIQRLNFLSATADILIIYPFVFASQS